MRTATVWMRTWGLETGVWCEVCALPSAVEVVYDLTCSRDAAPGHLRTTTECVECGTVTK